MQPYSSSNRYQWTPLDSDVGLHIVQVWVRQTGSSESWEAFGSTGYFRVTPEPPPRAQNIDVTLLSDGSYLFQAFATEGVDPLQYRFMLFSATSGVRTIVQDYSPANQWTWRPAATDIGNFIVEVWVKNPGSPLDLEAEMFSPWVTR